MLDESPTFVNLKMLSLENLLDFYNDVFNIYDKTKAVDIIYLDFQKAFDKVPQAVV